SGTKKTVKTNPPWNGQPWWKRKLAPKGWLETKPPVSAGRTGNRAIRWTRAMAIKVMRCDAWFLALIADHPVYRPRKRSHRPSIPPEKRHDSEQSAPYLHRGLPCWVARSLAN